MKILLVPKEGNKRAHLECVQHIEDFLGSAGVEYNKVLLPDLKRENVEGTNLILSLGGDGAAAGASHFIRNELMMGVNTDYAGSEGHYCNSCITDFDRKIKSVLDGDFRTKELLRLETKINGELKAPALNEVGIGQYVSNDQTWIHMDYRDKHEWLRGDGMIVATPAGSTAMYLARGKKKPFTGDHAKFVFCGAYYGRLSNPTLLRGFVLYNDRLVFETKKPECMVGVDGPTRYIFNPGDVAEVRIAGTRLKVVDFD